MKATKVDKDLCIGCGLCCGICDEVFRMNEQGKAEAYQPAILPHRSRLRLQHLPEAERVQPKQKQ